MLNQSLNLRIGQQLKMTPQLQHAIRMLQLSAIELQQEVQEILESNPLLEEGEEEQATEGGGSSEQSSKEENGSESTSSETETNIDQDSSIPDELETDSNWEDTYDLPSMLGSSGAGADAVEHQEIHSASTTHRQLTPEQQAAAGAGPNVVRVSIGIEDADDLIRDLDQALTKACG